jgi:hypothetical protein
MYSGKDFDGVAYFIMFMVIIAPFLCFGAGILVGWTLWG